MSAISRLSVDLYLRSFSKITFKHGNFADVRAFFSSRLDGFSLTDPGQKLKNKINRGRVHWTQKYSVIFLVS